MQKCLATQIGKNVQVYIDDVVITTKEGSTLIDDLRETFDNLDKFCLKLNPTKCSFGVPAGELLGFLVSARGIEANPEKIQAIVTMRKPTNLKEIQQLTGRVAALSRFVARLGEKALPLYALIKKGEKFEWNEEADRAFEDLKRTISTPLILVAPKEKEPLMLYIAATPQVVSTALVVEREEEGKLHGVQRPVYFISEVLSPSKQRLSFQDKTLLDTACSGSFTRNKEEFKWDLLDRIQENTEGWENDKGRVSGRILISIMNLIKIKLIHLKGPLEEDIQDPELKDEVESEDEEEVEEIPRVHQRATIASIGVISNPSNTKRSAWIATGGAVPRRFLAPRTSSPGNYHPFRNLIYNRQTERTPKVVLPSGWDIDRSNIAGEMKPEAEGWGNNSKSWDSPSDMLMSRVEHNSELIRNLTYEIEDLKELVKKLVEKNPSPSPPKE
ncbi:hypothetical protein QYE76_011466 [Lolium multiflorum]|uniref:Reverse transcriptase/retrotransposon-derived protein RNase H-like domain-containing protein n=1 Tax=Lolium multiflorum TaxID=4521 RepID=A0AAD8TZJ6_LOLMU|nr:hypothetical protein QYE76_011466 [Lolium multiflorum]